MVGSSEYTFRYLKADGTFSRVLVMQCADDLDAFRKAVDHLDANCTALEISRADAAIWRGLKEDAIEAAKSS